MTGSQHSSKGKPVTAAASRHVTTDQDVIPAHSTDFRQLTRENAGMTHRISSTNTRRVASGLGLLAATGALILAVHSKAGARSQYITASSEKVKNARRSSSDLTADGSTLSSGVRYVANARSKSEAKMELGFQEKMPHWLRENHVPAVGIAIIEGGRLKEARVFGELRKGVPAPANTLFEVASLTKPVVTMLTLKLVAAGQWNLDEPLANYWVDPDIKEDPRHKKLTTRIVLSHQTGFPNWRTDSPSKKLAFEFEPGTRYQYSGEGFEYLRLAMEHKFKKPLEQIASASLLTPLGMKSTRFYWDKTVDESRFAMPHDKDGRVLELRKTTSALASDRLITTIEEYGKFGVDVVNGAGLAKSIFNDMIKSQVSVPKSAGRSSAFGLGWELQRDLSNGEYALIHSGGDPGIRTLIILLPKTRRGLVVLTNGDNGFEVCKNVVAESLDVGKELVERS